MLLKGGFRLFQNIKYTKQLCFPTINSLKHREKYLFQNVQKFSSYDTESIEDEIPTKDFMLTIFRDYTSKNNNFKNPVNDIIRLNFTPDTRESLKLFNKLKENPLDENLWRKTLKCLDKELTEFTLDDFLKLISLSSRLYLSVKDKNFMKFLTSIDSELKSRKLFVDDILEILYVLNNTLGRKISLKRFHFYLKSHRMYLNLHKFQPLQVTHLFYYLTGLTTESKKFYRYSVFKYLKENSHLFTLKEIIIILTGLVRGKLFTYDDAVIEKMTHKILNEIEGIESLHLFYISKFLLECSSRKTVPIILDFQEKLIPHLSKFDTTSLVMLLLSNYPHSISQTLWNSVMEKIKPDFKATSFTDIERLARITTMFNVDDEEFLKLAVEAVEEREYVQKRFPHLVFFIKHLITHKIYSKKLLDIIFSKDFMADMISRKFSKELNEWTFINYSLKIDKPEYQCTCLDEVTEKKISSKLYDILPLGKPILSTVSIRSIWYKFLKEFYGEDKVTSLSCVPHFENGLIMTFDDNLEALPIPAEFKLGKRRIFRKALDDNIWICLNVCDIFPGGLTPIQKTYVRHLSAFGFTPVLVPRKDCYLPKFINAEETKEYIKNLIRKSREKNYDAEATETKINSEAELNP